MRDGWTYKKLGEVCEIFDSQRKPVTKSDRKKGCYPYYGATGIQDYVDSYIFDGRYLLIGEDGAKWSAMERTSFIIEGKSWVNNHAHILQTKEELIDTYLMYYLNCTDLDNYISGAIVRKLTQASLREIQIPLPPIPQQRLIVSELDEINSLLALKREQLKKYDELVQSLFYEMFGDPVENEKGWEVKKWKDLFDTKLGKMLDKSKQNTLDLSFPYLANTNVQWGTFDLVNLRTMTFTKEEYHKFELKKGDLLICEGGEAGRCAIWKHTNSLIKYQKAIHRARKKEDNIEVEYVRYFLQYFRELGGLKDFLTKSTIEHLTGEKLNTISIPLPPLSLQHLFAQRIEQIEEQKKQITAAIAKLETLLASRMQYWFE